VRNLWKKKGLLLNVGTMYDKSKTQRQSPRDEEGAWNECQQYSRRIASNVCTVTVVGPGWDTRCCPVSGVGHFWWGVPLALSGSVGG
jgi:hypothetical protein